MAARWRIGATPTAGVLLVATTLVILWPMLQDFSAYGFHDWDSSTAFRYLTVLSINRYREAPWWNPWLCGGYPGFGHHEGASNFISPYLPLYLLADLRTAIRIEVLTSALVGVAGTYVLATRVTRSVALRSLLAVAYALNGRWALQAAVGHAWHLQYAWLPWILWSFDRAAETGRLTNAVSGGALLALMVYGCGIYPGPHTVLVLGVYAVLLSAFTRRWRPSVMAGITVIAGLGLSAPKLFAVADAMQHTPRTIASTETIGLFELLVMLLDPTQTYGSSPVPVPAYGWHEWGMYVGPAVATCLTLGVLFANGARGNALRLVGLLLLLLGFGAFHPLAPWAILHKLPLFASQHVPARFLYPMVLMLGLSFVAWAARFVDPRVTSRPWLDLLMLAGVAWIAADIAGVARRPFTQAFTMVPRSPIQPADVFEHRTDPPAAYARADFAPPMLLAMFANTGVIDCYPLGAEFTRVGAIAADSERYRGRAYVSDGSGTADIVEWSPNRALVRVTGSSPNALVVYNMNYDESWKANGKPAMNLQSAVAARLAIGESLVEFRYFPRTLKYSVPIAVTTALACAAALWRDRRVTRQQGRR